MGAAAQGVVGVFEDEDGGTLGEDEAVAVGVERAGREARGAGPAGQGPHLGQAGDGHAVAGGLGAAGEDDVAGSRGDQVAGDREGGGARGAGAGDAEVGAAHPQVDGDLGGGRAGEAAGQAQGGDQGGTVLAEEGEAFEVGLQAVAGGAENDADARGGPGVGVELGVDDGLPGRTERQVGETIRPAGQASPVGGDGLEVLDAAGDVDGQAGQFRILLGEA